MKLCSIAMLTANLLMGATLTHASSHLNSPWQGSRLSETLNNLASITISKQDIKNRHDLYNAVQKGDIKVIYELIRAGVNLNVVEEDGDTPLHVAAAYGHENVLEALINAGVNIKAKCSRGYTPLHLAAMYNHSTAVQILISNEADVDAVDKDNESPLNIAEKKEYIDIVKMLKAAQQKRMLERHTLHSIESKEKGAKKISSKVSKVAADMQTIGFSIPLHSAAVNGRAKETKILLRKGASPNQQDANKKTPLHLASQNDHTEVVAILLREGADLNIKDCLPNIRSFLIGGRIPTYDNGFTALYWPAIKGYENIVRILIDSGAEVNAQDGARRTLLHISIMHGAFSIVDLLISEGADVNICDIEGKCALHFAVEKGDLYIVKKVIKAKPRLDQKTILGLTPLDLALKNGNKTIVNMLIKAGVKISRINLK